MFIDLEIYESRDNITNHKRTSKAVSVYHSCVSNLVHALYIGCACLLVFVGETINAQMPLVTTVTIDNNNNANTAILDFDPVADPDQVFISGSQALAPTVFNGAMKVNSNASVDQARVMPLMLNEERGADAFAAQGGDTVSAMFFANWQYVDKMVAWGGTATRNVTAPGQAWIDAAHRNGVKIYGNVFFAPTAFGGDIAQVDFFTQTDGQGNYPIADKLIEIAETQGFDGWFINQETGGGDSALAEDVGQLLDYIQNNSSIEVIWYDAMTESGSVGWQDQLNTSNDRFLQDGSQRVSDAMFLDFTPSASELASSKTIANGLGRSEFDLYAGANFQETWIAGGDSGMNTALTSNSGGHAASVGMFRPHQEIFDYYRDNGRVIEDYVRMEEQLYVGETGDPSDTTALVDSTPFGLGSTSWNGIAHHIAAKSPLVRDRFVSNFNYGIGYDYFIDGEVSNAGDWNNLSAQDVLPTWRWITETTDATPVDVDWDFTDAYIGGSSIRIEGSLDAETDVPLYLASMDVHDDSKLTLTYKTGEVGASEMQVYIELEGQEGTRIPFNVGSTSTTGWNEVELDLAAYDGQTIAGIGLRLLDADDASYGVSIGQLGVIRGERDIVAPATGIDFQSIEQQGDSTELRMTWDHSLDYSSDFATNNVYYYNVYQKMEDGSRQLLGVTGGEGLYIEDVVRDGDELNSEIIVEAISLEFGVSEEATILVSWGDINGDNVLDDTDIEDFIAGWKSDTSSLSYSEKVLSGDLNADGTTDFEDWFLLRAAFSEQGITLSTNLLAVPEPSALLLTYGVLLGISQFHRIGNE